MRRKAELSKPAGRVSASGAGTSGAGGSGADVDLDMVQNPVFDDPPAPRWFVVANALLLSRMDAVEKRLQMQGTAQEQGQERVESELHGLGKRVDGVQAELQKLRAIQARIEVIEKTNVETAKQLDEQRAKIDELRAMVEADRTRPAQAQPMQQVAQAKNDMQFRLTLGQAKPGMTWQEQSDIVKEALQLVAPGAGVVVDKVVNPNYRKEAEAGRGGGPQRKTVLLFSVVGQDAVRRVVTGRKAGGDQQLETKGWALRKHLTGEQMQRRAQLSKAHGAAINKAKEKGWDWKFDRDFQELWVREGGDVGAWQLVGSVATGGGAARPGPSPAAQA